MMIIPCELHNRSVILDRCGRRKKAILNQDRFVEDSLAYAPIFVLFQTTQTEIRLRL